MLISALPIGICARRPWVERFFFTTEDTEKVTHFDDRNQSKECKRKLPKLNISWNLNNEHPKAVESHPKSQNSFDLVLAISPDKLAKALLDAQYCHLHSLYDEFSEEWETEKSKHFTPFRRYLMSFH